VTGKLLLTGFCAEKRACAMEQAVNSVTGPTDHNIEPLCTYDVSNDADWPKEGPFGGLSDENFFHRDYPFPKNFKGHFICKSKKSNNFRQVRDSQKIPKPTYRYTKSGSRNRTVTSPSGITRPLAAEIVIPLLLTSQKRL
jgi:hypothetical protein